MTATLPRRPAAVLILPGWNGSGPAHWQSRWEALYGDTRVEQHDWQRPLRGDWTARLEDVVLAQRAPVLLAAHSLGCLLAVWWAAHSRSVSRVAGALLVAPPDIGCADVRQNFPGWLSRKGQDRNERLPFPSILAASRDDPFCAIGAARQLAAEWGSVFHDAGPRGHLNADSGLGDWPEGRRLLLSLTGAGVPA